MKDEGNFSRFTRIGIVAIIVIIGALLILPIPALLLDILIAFNLIIALLILLIVLYSKNPTDFSLFPSVVLASAVFCLFVNISATRLILVKGTAFNGQLICFVSSLAFSSETGNQELTAVFVIFIILTIVYVLFVAKGCVRISEVAARFMLDSLPAKQMLIDSKYSSGAIDQAEAASQKEQLQIESNFFGALYGASKFISGNIKVEIIITVINITGGLFIGIFFRGELLTDVLKTYISLAIGSDIFFMVPSLLVAVAVGIAAARKAET